jgi:F-type H+-transporting ATPase subunit epsilon
MGDGMSEKKIHLKITTPHEVKVDQKADMVIFRSISGDMGVLPGHEATAAVLADGAVRIFDEGKEKKITVFGGIASVQNSKVSILTSSARWPEDSDNAKTN